MSYCFILLESWLQESVKKEQNFKYVNKTLSIKTCKHIQSVTMNDTKQNK